jgi:hypothetical protein
MKFSDKLLALVKSRRFLLGVAGVAAVACKELFGMDEQQVLAIAGIVVSWIVSDSVRPTV